MQLIGDLGNGRVAQQQYLTRSSTLNLTTMALTRTHEERNSMMDAWRNQSAFARVVTNRWRVAGGPAKEPVIGCLYAPGWLNLAFIKRSTSCSLSPFRCD